MGACGEPFARAKKSDARANGFSPRLFVSGKPSAVNTRDSFMGRKISIKKLAGKQKMVYVESV
jgi:hypothetical protein